MHKEDSAAARPRTPSKGEMLTRAEAAELTGLTAFTLDQYRSMRRRGVERGPAFVKVGRSVLYPRGAVDAFLAKREG